MKKSVTQRQFTILRKVADLTVAIGRDPALREVAHAIGTRTSDALAALEPIQKRGWVRLTDGVVEVKSLAGIRVRFHAPRVRLTPEAVRAMRADRSGMTLHALGRKYGCSTANAGFVCSRRYHQEVV